MASPQSPVADRGSLKHLIGERPTTEADDASDTTQPAPSANKADESNDTVPQATTPRRSSPSKTADVETPGGDGNTPNYTANPTTTRRNANGSVSSVYSGNKIRHLKKDDGVPLWRKDIQYDFLKTVFEDEKQVFHKMSDGTGGHSFADVYLDAMAKSSKCSRILKDKLLSDRPAGVNMAMVCLLVNVGRMNTTLNFFPEMRAQLRTYHSIPSLQATQDTNAYKQLQDAPRLKSILKGATEDIEQPGTIDDIKAAPIPRTNPVNLIFVLAQQAPKISEMHFDVPRDFFDLVMKEGLSSSSRAKAFLWLMWWYLESDFSLNDALNNPFGPGRRSRDAPAEELPIKCPQFDFLTDEETLLENVDTQEELDFGELKRQERLAIINGDVTPLLTGPKRFNVQKSKMYPQNPVFAVNTNGFPSDEHVMRDAPSPSLSSGKNVFRNKTIEVKPRREYTSDSDQTRPTSPVDQSAGPKASRSRAIEQITDETPARASSKGPGRGNWRRKVDANGEPIIAPRSAPKGAAVDQPKTIFVPVNGADPSQSKRARPPTIHQLALESFRKQRVNHIIDRGLRKAREKATKKRKSNHPVIRAWKRVRALDSGYDSEEEAHMTGAGRPGAARLGVALGGFASKTGKLDDFGEESAEIGYMFGRLIRRSDPIAQTRWREDWLARHPEKKEEVHDSRYDWPSDAESPVEWARAMREYKARNAATNGEGGADSNNHGSASKKRPGDTPKASVEIDEDDDEDEMDVDDRNHMQIPQFNPTPVAQREEEHWSEDDDDDEYDK